MDDEEMYNEEEQEIQQKVKKIWRVVPRVFTPEDPDTQFITCCMTQYNTAYISCSDKRIILIDCKDFSLKKEYEVENEVNVLNMILTPKYIIMHDEENCLNWVTAFEEPYYTEMNVEKSYDIQGGNLQ